MIASWLPSSTAGYNLPPIKFQKKSIEFVHKKYAEILGEKILELVTADYKVHTRVKAALSWRRVECKSCVGCVFVGLPASWLP